MATAADMDLEEVSNRIMIAFGALVRTQGIWFASAQSGMWAAWRVCDLTRNRLPLRTGGLRICRPANPGESSRTSRFRQDLRSSSMNIKRFRPDPEGALARRLGLERRFGTTFTRRRKASEHIIDRLGNFCCRGAHVLLGTVWPGGIANRGEARGSRKEPVRHCWVFLPRAFEYDAEVESIHGVRGIKG